MIGLGTNKLLIPKAGTSLLENLISCWEFDEVSGIVYDLHGSNNGINYNATTNQAGKIGKSYYYNHSNSVVRMNNSYDFSGDFSISSWFKPTYDYGETYYQYILANGDVYDGMVSVLIVMYLKYGQIFFSIKNGQETLDPKFYNSGNYGFEIQNNWAHYVGVYDSATKTAYCYLNGILVDSMTNLNIGNISVPHNISIGYPTEVSSEHRNRYFQGYIDQTLIYSRKLSSEEIGTLYNDNNGLAYSNW